MDRRPDRRALDCGHRTARDLRRLAEPSHVLDRDLDAQLERLSATGVEDPHRPRRAGVVETTEEARDLVERTLGRGEPDPLQPRRVRSAQLLEPFERYREVRSALARNDGVDLVDDHRLDLRERRPGQAREHEVERLGRGDEDVRWLALVPRALPRRGIARADRDGRLAVRDAEALRLPDDSHKRRPQVALDVDREGLQRRHIEHAGMGVLRGRSPRNGEHEAVDGGEERGQRLTRSGGREDERALARGDRRPRELLRARGHRERRLEPGARRLMEGRERVAPHVKTIPFAGRGDRPRN